MPVIDARAAADIACVLRAALVHELNRADTDFEVADSEFTGARGARLQKDVLYATSFLTLAKVLSFSQVPIAASSFLLPVGVRRPCCLAFAIVV